MTGEEHFTYIEKLLQDILQRLDEHDKRFDRLEQRLDEHDKRFDRLEQYLLEFRREMIQRLEAIEYRLTHLESTVASMDARLPGMTKAIQEFAGAATRFAIDQNRQDELAQALLQRVAKLEELVAALRKPAA
jgi:chromosome segregation ATPase